jgi:cysteine-rich repeat protein
MGSGGIIPTVSRGGASGTGGTLATGGTRPTGGSNTGGRSSVGGSSTGTSSTGGRIGPDASAGGSVGRDGAPAEVPRGDLPVLSLSTGGSLGVDGPVATGGVPRTDGPTARGGVLATGGGVSQGGAVGSGGAVASGGASAGTGGSPGICGDEHAGSGEQCDLGAGNAESAAFVVTQGELSFPAVPFIRTGTGADFYSYSSASAHTGYEAPGMSRILLYLDKATRVLSLIVFHGVDQDSTGLEQPASTVQLLFSGLPDSTAIGISDDSNELIMTSSTTATGLWNFTNNSDGGVLHGLPLPGDWTLAVEPYFIKGDWKWTWLGPDGSEVYLDLTQPLTIQARSKHGQCRTNCTIPQCGDGIWDAGEVCDDGQPSKSGCSLNCMSFN